MSTPQLGSGHVRTVEARRPDFFFLGPDKAGSSWLQSVLREHPQVFVPAAKDTFYFATEFDRGVGWYLRHFRSATPEHAAVGEICHDYLTDPGAVGRIAQVLPDARLVVCLREPVERAYSAYLNKRRHADVAASFEEALASDPELVDHSRYARHVERVLAHFPREQLLVLWFDDLQRDPQALLDRLCDFLGAPRLALSPERRQPTRAAASARSRSFARVVKAAALLVRRCGHASLVGRIKGSVLVQRLLYRPVADDELAVPSEGAAAARRLLAEDTALLPHVLGTDLPERWGGAR